MTMTGMTTMSEGDGLFLSIVSSGSLHNAWRKVKANRGCGGSDQISLRQFEKNLNANIGELSRNLTNGTYVPLPVRNVRISKPNGSIRELGILTIRDRVAQRALLDAIESRFEAEMFDCNYAFRAGRNVEMAIQQIILLRASGLRWTVESDIKDFFACIDRERLLKEIARVVPERRLLHLIRLWLDAGILGPDWLTNSKRSITRINDHIFAALAEQLSCSTTKIESGDALYLRNDFGASEGVSFSNEEEYLKSASLRHLIADGFRLAFSHKELILGLIGAKTVGVAGAALAGLYVAPKVLEKVRRMMGKGQGILQGSPLSPVLANFYLNEMDREFTHAGNGLVRYCDDFVISCSTRQEAEENLATARKILSKRGLSLHPDKTRIVSPGEEFSFLGYKFLTDGSIEAPPLAAARLIAYVRSIGQNIRVRANAGVSEIRRKVER
jgi:RNA-directed DNA polymerase